jgi:hypothetical protein
VTPCKATGYDQFSLASAALAEESHKEAGEGKRHQAALEEIIK